MDNNTQNMMQPPMGMSQEEMKGNLSDLASKVQDKYNGFQAKNFAAQATSTKQQKDTLKKIFDTLMSSGIDLSNQEQVTQFMDELKQSNPENYQLFEQVLLQLLGPEQQPEGSESQQPPEGMAPESPMEQIMQ